MLAGAGKFVDDMTKLGSGAMSDNLGRAAGEVASEFATSFIPTFVRQGEKFITHLKVTTFKSLQQSLKNTHQEI